MANFITKKDGTKEAFNPEKIKRVVGIAAADAGLAKDKADGIVEQVLSTVMQSTAGKEEIAAADLKKIILDRLDAIAPSVSQAWRNYEKTK